MRVVIYARASTKDKQTPEHQLAEIRAYAQHRTWTVVAEFVERESGRKDDRPMFTEALELVRAGKADGIVSTELSRWGRSTKHLLDVGNEFRSRGWHLVATRQQIDTTTAMGRFVFTLLAALAEFEADLTRERVAAGVAYAKAQRGGAWGRRREPIPDAALRRAADLLNEGDTWRQVSWKLADQGFQQPAKTSGRGQHLARPWPTGTLREALQRAVGLPPPKNRRPARAGRGSR